MMIQPLSRKVMRSALLLASASLLLLPVDGHSQVPESSKEIVASSSFEKTLSGPCGEYFGIDSCHTDSFKGIVTEVLDPDLLVIRLASNKTVRVRIAGVNVPAEFAEDARQLLSSQLLTQPVEVIIFCMGQLPKGRLVGRVWVGGNEVNFELISQGFAYAKGWEGLSSYDRCVYRMEQEEAKAKRRGLWSRD